MVVTKKYIGDVICRYDSGERFLIDSVLGNLVFFQKENGKRECAANRSISGGIERDITRIASFHANLAFAHALDAAEGAARRRLSPGQPDELAKQEASRILAVIGEQRSAFNERLNSERQAAKAGPDLASQFLDSLSQRPAGASATFFGVTVQFCGGPSHFFRLADSPAVWDQQAMASFLSELTAGSPARKALSFENLISSAKDRASRQQEPSRVSFDLNR